MRLLFEMDKKDYRKCTHAFIRNSARSIIIVNNKIAMIHSLKYDYYKFPGGGIESGEKPIDAMIRETREESGLVVKPETIKEYGYVHRIQKSNLDETECFVQDNYYYLCEAEDCVVAQNLDEYEFAETYTYLSRSLEIINTMESMVQEILTVSRMKSSKVGLRKEKMDFSDLLKREYALFEDLIVQKEIDWNENISPALQIVVDKMLIQKAINNIVSNAILYSPRGSSIYMDAFPKNGSVVFQIENTGVHIPEAEIPKLFDAFYRMEQSRNRKTGGSGLGLYIVKTILEQHNIIYSLKNTDRGVLFSIRF